MSRISIAHYVGSDMLDASEFVLVSHCETRGSSPEEHVGILRAEIAHLTKRLGLDLDQVARHELEHRRKLRGGSGEADG